MKQKSKGHLWNSWNVLETLVKILEEIEISLSLAQLKLERTIYFV